MFKKFLPLVLAPLLFGGCAAQFTNLTPRQQTRNANNLYPVEVALTSRQQTLRWSTIQPQILVGSEFYPMHPTPLLTNRWEGLVPVQPGESVAHYRYKFDFQDTSFGGPKSDSAVSPQYTLKVLDQ
jgi:hypothetical protein